MVASNAANVLVFFVIFSFLYALYWGLFLLSRFLLFPEKRKEKTKKEQKKEAEYVNRFWSIFFLSFFKSILQLSREMLF